ncbi:phage Gp37/Gp68 family protein [Brevibacillus sp. MER 51]|uniref:DUF5131 family protein n=1 Tax=Brevibacillus sp. MER 51 TaxID=2939560 RepID=UPI00203F88D6|nr:phage Gp37/Gp68 family protein [Brevibacillus sp. MER 51]MCM3144336.1 phage Gp37/Gp68 family protein [Brevibacillus sp. MER 51]
MGTAIEWTDVVWNPVTGCSKVSEGCRNCYAFALHDMRHKAFLEGKKLPQQYSKSFKELQLFSDRLEQPVKWKKPRKIFVNSMSDLFHKDVPGWFIKQVFDIMMKADWHVYQVLTKRADRMREIVTAYLEHEKMDKLPPHIWIGVSVENEDANKERVHHLVKTKASVRFLSCEPLLGPIDLSVHLNWLERDTGKPYIHWIIAGGESGSNARPMRQYWVESLRDQCKEFGVAFFFKQWGEFLPHEDDDEDPEFWVTDEGAGFVHTSIPTDDDWDYMNRVGKKRAGRLLDGQEWNQFPAHI